MSILSEFTNLVYAFFGGSFTFKLFKRINGLSEFIFVWVLCLQVESNGTVLSTNWKEVGSKKVEGSAPDGMEMRKWEY